ncbi:hypothetical protein BRD00_03980 [Halobacteriales archaeon QS_8_69_26]|nr:MAG: hypothetical protein BRD00_03980 [Halobacteriales archaeon QS_8_69_26]
MVEFDLRGVAGGWEQARYGPPDQVDYVLRADEGALESYDSVHSFLKLYDLARLKTPDHPRFLGFGVREDPGGDSITVEVHGMRVRTTYPELESALAAFLAEVFEALDDQTPGDRREHVEALDDSDEVVAELPELYDRLVGTDSS